MNRENSHGAGEVGSLLALMLCTAFGGCSRGASTTLKSGAEPDKDKDKEGRELRIKLWSTVTKRSS